MHAMNNASPDYVICDGIRMSKADIEGLLTVLDPMSDPKQWNMLFKHWNRLDMRERRRAKEAC